MLDLGNSGSGSAAERYVRIRWHNDRRVLDAVSVRSNMSNSCANCTQVKNEAVWPCPGRLSCEHARPLPTYICLDFVTPSLENVDNKYLYKLNL